jgi:hypothetical protein
MICHYDLINFLFCTDLTQAEVDRFVGAYLIRMHLLCDPLAYSCPSVVKILLR